jgi:hypothetical protein
VTSGVAQQAPFRPPVRVVGGHNGRTISDNNPFADKPSKPLPLLLKFSINSLEIPQAEKIPVFDLGAEAGYELDVALRDPALTHPHEGMTG